MFVIPAILAILNILVAVYCYYLHVIVRNRLTNDAEKAIVNRREIERKVCAVYWTELPNL